MHVLKLWGWPTGCWEGRCCSNGDSDILRTLGTQPSILGAFSGCCLTLRLRLMSLLRPSTVHTMKTVHVCFDHTRALHTVEKFSASELRLHSHCLRKFSWRQGFFDLPRLALNANLLVSTSQVAGIPGMHHLSWFLMLCTLIRLGLED